MDSGDVEVDYIPTRKEVWERRMIAASLTIEKQQARCIACGDAYMPRYIGEQICSACRGKYGRNR